MKRRTTADTATTCSLVPTDVACQLLGTTRRQANDCEVRSGSGAEGDASSTCTLVSEDEDDPGHQCVVVRSHVRR